MRLINAKNFRLELFATSPPDYAILSHTWGADQDEVNFGDIQELRKAERKPGFAKIRFACHQAMREGYDYVWVDTCCIDKSSSAELSEAINSMFKYYKNSGICYAYLSDVDTASSSISPTVQISQARWFTRSWTLQELLAPRRVTFYSGSWKQLGTRNDLSRIISKATGINEAYINRRKFISLASTAERMSWAAMRQATRQEDLAYSLLGLFDVHMPLLYGEGSKAFLRLQREIIRQSEDDSIFAWVHPNHNDLYGGWVDDALAPGPECFRDSSDIVTCRLREASSWDPPVVTSRGIQIQTPLLPSSIVHADAKAEEGDRKAETYALLKCRRKGDFFNLLAVPVTRLAIAGRATYARAHRKPLAYVDFQRWTDEPNHAEPDKICLADQMGDLANRSTRDDERGGGVVFRLHDSLSLGSIHPASWWDEEECYLHVEHDSPTGSGEPMTVLAYIKHDAKNSSAILSLNMMPRDPDHCRQDGSWEVSGALAYDPAGATKRLDLSEIRSQDLEWKGTLTWDTTEVTVSVEEKWIFGVEMYVVDVSMEISEVDP